MIFNVKDNWFLDVKMRFDIVWYPGLVSLVEVELETVSYGSRLGFIFEPMWLF